MGPVNILGSAVTPSSHVLVGTGLSDMSIDELSSYIRTHVPDGPEKKNILTALNDISDGVNQMLGYLLSVSGHKYDAQNETWSKKKMFFRNVNT